LIKSFLILVLGLAFTAGAFLSRPTEAEFRAYLKERKGSAKGMTFHDRLLWVQVEDGGGAVQFTGAFAHWLERGNWIPRRQSLAAK
jgi:hypothetical protein